jgi:hypothetical protein
MIEVDSSFLLYVFVVTYRALNVEHYYNSNNNDIDSNWDTGGAFLSSLPDMSYVTIKSWRYEWIKIYLRSFNEIIVEFDTAFIKNERYSHTQVAIDTLQSAEKMRINVGRDAETNTCKDGTSLEWLYTVLLLQSKVVSMQTIKSSSTLCSGWR